MVKFVKYMVNFLEVKEGDLYRIEILFKFYMLYLGLVYGLVFWFDVVFIGFIMIVWLFIVLIEFLIYWYQVWCLFQLLLFVKVGDMFLGICLFIVNKRQSYDISIVVQVDQIGFKFSNFLDLKNFFFRYMGMIFLFLFGFYYIFFLENMWNIGSIYNFSSGMVVVGMLIVYDLSSVIVSGFSVGYNNLIFLGFFGVQGSGGGGISVYYVVNSQFIMGGFVIFMVLFMFILINIMYYGSQGFVLWIDSIRKLNDVFVCFFVGWFFFLYWRSLNIWLQFFLLWELGYFFI